jgi:hypothetical protein
MTIPVNSKNMSRYASGPPTASDGGIPAPPGSSVSCSALRLIAFHRVSSLERAPKQIAMSKSDMEAQVAGADVLRAAAGE